MSLFRTRDRDFASLQALEVKAAVHDQKITDHDKVLVSIQDHLGILVEKIGGFERKLIILACVIAAGTPGGSQLISRLAASLGL